MVKQNKAKWDGPGIIRLCTARAIPLDGLRGVDARQPKPATVTWPAHFGELMGKYRPELPGDPAYLLTFLPQGGIGLDQRTGKGKAA